MYYRYGPGKLIEREGIGESIKSSMSFLRRARVIFEEDLGRSDSFSVSDTASRLIKIYSILRFLYSGYYFKMTFL
jgi:hypothetical protein